MGGVILLTAGLGLAALGLALLGRATGQLRRSGAFGGIFWSSFRHYGEYRRRALRPLPSAFLGLLLLAAGLAAAYWGLAGFYAERLGRIQG